MESSSGQKIRGQWPKQGIQVINPRTVCIISSTTVIKRADPSNARWYFVRFKASSSIDTPLTACCCAKIVS